MGPNGLSFEYSMFRQIEVIMTNHVYVKCVTMYYDKWKQIGTVNGISDSEIIRIIKDWVSPQWSREDGEYVEGEFMIADSIKKVDDEGNMKGTWLLELEYNPTYELSIKKS